jgi:hypothetical protein
VKVEALVSGFKPPTTSTPSVGQVSQWVALRSNQGFCVKCPELILYAKYQLVTTSFAMSVSRLPAESWLRFMLLTQQQGTDNTIAIKSSITDNGKSCSRNAKSKI